MRSSSLVRDAGRPGAGDVRSSGKVAAGESVNVAFGGAALMRDLAPPPIRCAMPFRTIISRTRGEIACLGNTVFQTDVAMRLLEAV